MKTVKKLFSFFVLVLFMGSCSNSKDSLTKADAMTLLKQKDIDKPLQITRRSYNGDYKIKHSNTDQLAFMNSLKQLEADGQIDLTLVSKKTKKYGNKTELFSTYNVSIKPEHEKYTIQTSTSRRNLLLMTVKAKSVLEIENINAKFAKATVEFEKIKTPFYREEYIGKKSYFKNKSDLYTQQVIFRKGNVNKWEITTK